MSTPRHRADAVEEPSRAPELPVNVVWMRESGSRVAHAFAEIDLSVGFERVEPLAPCGRFRLAELQRDDHAARCRACERSAEQSGQ